MRDDDRREGGGRASSDDDGVVSKDLREAAATQAVQVEIPGERIKIASRFVRELSRSPMYS